MLCLPTIGMAGVIDEELKTIEQPFDTTRDAGYWKRALMHGRLDIKDTTVVYPRTLDMAVDLYRWGDRTFNSYDSTYVMPAGKNWKLQCKYSGLVGVYHGRLRESDLSIFLNSELSSNAGLRISFMALGVEYMPSVSSIFNGRQAHSHKLRFSFTCSRIAAEAYYIKSTGRTYVHRFGGYNNGHIFSEPYDGMSRSVLGVDAYYFFNYSRYAHAAAYCFSKYQRVSAGSFVVGFQYANQDASFDVDALPPALLEHLPEEHLSTLSCHFWDYAINIGYAYNWVFKPNWLLNFMVTPSIGVKRVSTNRQETYSNHLSTNYRGKISLVHNHGQLFYGVYGSINGYIYYTNQLSLYAHVIELNAAAGVRF